MISDRTETVSDTLFVTSGEKAYQDILHRITSGEIKPGTRLVRRTLALELGVSPIPILEALKRLEQDGLIEYRAQWGCIVTVPTLTKVKDLFVMREALESQVARILSCSTSESQKTALEELAADLDRVRFESEDLMLIADHHYRFHMAMAEFAGSESITNALRRINFFWLLCRAAQHRKRKANLQRYWHASLLETIFSEGPDAADQAMRAHIQDSFAPFLESFGETETGIDHGFSGGSPF